MAADAKLAPRTQPVERNSHTWQGTVLQLPSEIPALIARATSPHVALDLLRARKGRRLVGVTAVFCCSAMISDAFSGGAATLRRPLRGDRQILALIEVVLIDGQAPIQSVRPSTKSIASKIKDFSVLFSPMRTT